MALAQHAVRGGSHELVGVLLERLGCPAGRVHQGDRPVIATALAVRWLTPAPNALVVR